MDISQLKATGLSSKEAAAYGLLLDKGSIAPPDAAKALHTSRTNTYKLFDKLVEYGLAKKIDKSKKIHYQINNPIALNDYVYAYRAEAVSREEAVNSLMKDLVSKYNKHSPASTVDTMDSKDAVVAGFKKQLSLKEDIHFIHTRSDVASMGWDTMHTIRTEPARHDLQRYGIMSWPKDKTSPINDESHKRSNLAVTRIEQGLYTEPVEWSVTKSSLLIIVYGKNIHGIFIQDSAVSAAFLQLWQIIKLSAEKKTRSGPPSK